jgi:hypothetical protein
VEAKKQHEEAEKKVKEAEEAAKKKPEPKPEPPKKEEPKVPEITLEPADDEEEHGIVEDAPDENAEKEARAAEGGNLDDEGEQEVKEEE